MEKSLFEQRGGTYIQVGDYLLPNIILPEQEEKPIGMCTAAITVSKTTPQSAIL